MATITDAGTLAASSPRRARSLRPLLSRVALRCHSFVTGAAGGAGRLSLVTMRLPAAGMALHDSSSPSVDWAGVVASVPDAAKVVLAGDPVQSPFFEEVIFEADRRDLFVTVETTGACLEEFAPVIYGLDVAALRLRLYGPEEVHNAACGSRAFADAVRGAMSLAALAGETGRPYVEAMIPVTPSNHSHLAETVECAVGMGAASVVICHPRPAAADAGGLAAIDMSILNAQSKRIAARWPGTVRFVPDLSAQDTSRYYSGDMSCAPRKCLVPLRTMSIDAAAAMSLCDAMPLGIFDGSPLAHAFNCESSRAFRRRLLRGLPDCCSACAGRFAGEEDMS